MRCFTFVGAQNYVDRLRDGDLHLLAPLPAQRLSPIARVGQDSLSLLLRAGNDLPILGLALFPAGLSGILYELLGPGVGFRQSPFGLLVGGGDLASHIRFGLPNLIQR